MTETKLYTLLAKTDALAASFKQGLKNYISFFKSAQGAFQGKRNTYHAAEGTIDEPNRRGAHLIQTTVKEKLDYFTENTADYINSLFSQEATNASGNPRAELIVGGNSWGEFSSLELLRLKSFLENGDFKGMHASIPVRSDSKIWKETTDEEYADREGVYEGPLFEYSNKSTEKESYILPDPNIDKLKTSSSYTPQVAVKTVPVVLGDGTEQHFTGEWSQRQKAQVLRRIDLLHVAVIEALKRANDCVIVKSEITSEKIYGYIHG